MIRLCITSLSALTIVVADVTGHYFVALAAGVIVGALYFVASAVGGGGLRPVGMAARQSIQDLPKQPTDSRAGIGTALAASGIASSVVADERYPLPFRIFYGICIGAGVLIALWLAWRSRSEPPVARRPPSPG